MLPRERMYAMEIVIFERTGFSNSSLIRVSSSKRQPSGKRGIKIRLQSDRTLEESYEREHANSPSSIRIFLALKIIPARRERYAFLSSVSLDIPSLSFSHRSCDFHSRETTFDLEFSENQDTYRISDIGRRCYADGKRPNDNPGATGASRAYPASSNEKYG